MLSRSDDEDDGVASQGERMAPHFVDRSRSAA